MKDIVISSSWVGPSPDWVEASKLNHQKYAQRHGYSYFHHHHQKLNLRSDLQIFDFYVDAVWQQIIDVRELLNDPSVTWVFKTDTDSVFTNFDLDLERFTTRDADFVFTGDSYDIFNGGHFLIKNTKWSRDFLDLWLSFKDQLWEEFRTNHQSKNGRLLDQPLLNMILRKYKSLDSTNGLQAFNSMNGFPGNKERIHKFFWLTHAPTTRYRVYRARRLINQEIRNHLLLLPQSSFNSYPNRSPGQRAWRQGDFMIHFAGTPKSELEAFIKNVSNFLG
jgi:hypothetical protein